MRIALAQINPTVGDIKGNTAMILASVEQAKKAKADLVLFPELAVTGYPPEDLLLKPNFIKDNLTALSSIARAVKGITAVVGFVDCRGNDLFNAAAVVENGRIGEIYHKMFLPNYGVFDEKRYFAGGDRPLTVSIAGVSVGLAVCEDIWYDEGPARLECATGAKLVVVSNASPYHAGKVKEREAIIQRQAIRNKVFIAYTNTVGGQDELVFDGYSMVVSPRGSVIARAAGFHEELLVVDLPLGKKLARNPLKKKSKLLDAVEEVYQALVTGLGDYVRKNGFKKAVIGLSGGIDSALVAALAVDALGRENVYGIFMPTRYSSEESREDAEALARNLNIELTTVPIDDVFDHYLTLLAPHFKGLRPDITEENLQARIRGNIMMAFSNKFNWIVLTTGNKSEMSTGYATLYGDMAGGFAVIKDVPKVLVYKLAAWRNRSGKVIPRRVLTKAPTAELRANQKDSDSLPPYETLDPILKYYVEEDRGLKDIIGRGFEESTVRRVLNLVDKNEYKRRQSPPGIKITPRAFGRDRRMPITNRFNEYLRAWKTSEEESPCQGPIRRTTRDIVKE
jgi:NAD+ synthase (glutamine-hydrolysing)